MCTTSFLVALQVLFFVWVAFWGLFGCCSGCGCVFSTLVVVEIEMIVDLEAKNPPIRHPTCFT